MKIAVATTDGSAVSQHFGRSRGFLVFTVEDGKICNVEQRGLAVTPHESGGCKGSASSLAELLAGCSVLLCGGMGAGAAQSLQNLGLRPMVIAGVHDPEAVVRLFLEGKAMEREGGFCNCQH